MFYPLSIYKVEERSVFYLLQICKAEKWGMFLAL